MADQKSRGGKKQGDRKQSEGQKHQGVRPGSTAREKDRGNQDARQSPIDEELADDRRGTYTHGDTPSQAEGSGEGRAGQRGQGSVEPQAPARTPDQAEG